MHLHPNALAAASYRRASYFHERLKLEVPLRKFAFFTTIFVFSLLSTFASAQQADVMFGFGTLLSPGAPACNFSQSAGQLVCPEKGGLYPSVSADVIFHRRIGFAYDVTWRGGQGSYPASGQPYRPIINDFNAIYEPRFGKKLSVDLMGGIGVQSTRFYVYGCVNNNPFYCTDFTSNHNFLVHVGGGIKYDFWGHAFIRPEFHYYNINNNTNNFSGNNVLRVGASIGYTIGGPD
jgi:hypothetical protein